MEDSDGLANTTQQQSLLVFEVNNERLSLHQQSARSQQIGTGAAVWDASKVLAAYLRHRSVKESSLIRGRTVLELV